VTPRFLRAQQSATRLLTRQHAPIQAWVLSPDGRSRNTESSAEHAGAPPRHLQAD
jgi:hypothetical protein